MLEAVDIEGYVILLLFQLSGDFYTIDHICYCPDAKVSLESREGLQNGFIYTLVSEGTTVVIPAQKQKSVPE